MKLYKRIIILILILIMPLLFAIGCDKLEDLDLNSIDIEAIDAVDVPIGTYTIPYTIDDLNKYAEQFGVVVNISVVEGDDNPIDVSGNTFVVEEGKVYTVTINIMQGETAIKTKTITVTAVTGEGSALTSIAVTTMPTKVLYEQGEVFDPSGMVVTATYEDSSTEIIPNNSLTFKTDALSLNDVDFAITYLDKSVNITLGIVIEILPFLPAPANLTLDHYGYLFFDLIDNATSYEIWINGDTYTVTDNYTLISQYMTTPAEYTIKVRALGEGYFTSPYSEELTKSTLVVSIELTEPPFKTEYIEGETFDPTGILITATFSDDSEDILSLDDFLYWTGLLTLLDTQITLTHMDSSKTITIPLTIIPYDTEWTVTFGGGGGNLISGDETQTVNMNGSAIAPVYERKGFLFDGWDKSLDNITSNTTITAKWIDTSVASMGINYEISTGYIYNTVDYIWGSEKTVIIPAMDNGMPVKYIAPIAPPIYNNYLERIYIGRNIEFVSPDAFKGCPNLREFIVDEDNPYFHTQGGMLYMNDTLVLSPRSVSATVEIPEGTKGIGAFAFDGISDITHFVIPDSVTEIGSNAFRGTAWYDSQPDGLVYAGKVAYIYKNKEIMPTEYVLQLRTDTVGIAAGAFAHSPNLVGIELPEGLEHIGTIAFFYCENLYVVNVPSTVYSIGSQAFDNTGWYTMQPDGMIYLGYVAYKYKGVAPENIVLLNSTKGIADSAFNSQTALQYIYIPNDLQHIGHNAFSGCSMLEIIEIPITTESIGAFAFAGCTSLTIYAEASSKPDEWNNRFNPIPRIVIWDSINIVDTYHFVTNSQMTLNSVNAKILHLIEDVYKTDYDFIGWYDNEDCQGDPIAFPYRYSGKEKVITLYAGWEHSEYSYTVNNDEITITGLKETSTKTTLIIPDTINHYGKNVIVSAIWFNAFRDNETITEVIIGANIVSIGVGAFNGCTALERITIPSNVVSIGEHLLTGCESLEEVVLPFVEDETGVNKNSYLGYYFGGSAVNTEWEIPSSLIKVTIADGSTGIGEYAFNGGVNLKEINIPGSAAVIGGNAFINCSSLEIITVPLLDDYIPNTHSYLAYYFGRETYDDTGYVIPSSLTTVFIAEGTTNINEFAFYGFENMITHLGLPFSIESVHELATSSLSSLDTLTAPFAPGKILVGYFGGTSYEQYSKIPENLKTVNIAYGATHIPIKAFYKASNLLEVNIPETVTVIDNSAFKECSSIQSLILPNSVLRIYESAFEDCTSLIEITIPSSVTLVGKYVLRGCDNLEYLHAPLKSPYLNSNNSYLAYYFGGAQFDHISVIPETLKTLVIAEGLESITANTLRNNSLESITLPASLNSIQGGFNNFSKLKEILVSEESEYFASDDGVLYNKSLTRLVRYPSMKQGAAYDIFEGVTLIDMYAFADNSYLRNIDLPDGLNFISGYSFRNCINLEKLLMPDTVTIILSNVFDGCSGLTEVKISANITNMPTDLLKDCENIITLTAPFKYPYLVTTNSYLAYYFGGNGVDHQSVIPPTLKTLIISEGTESLNSSMFKDNVIETIVIPSSVTNIANLFKESHALKEIIVDEDNQHYASIDGVLYNKSFTRIVRYPIKKEGTNYSIIDGTTEIYINAFSYNKIVETVVIPHGVTKLSDNAFRGCESLISINLPSSINVIQQRAFSGCSSLIHIEVPEGLEVIAPDTFSYCTSLKTVILPSTIIEIRNSAFYSCSNLESVTMKAEYPPLLNAHYPFLETNDTFVLYVPAGSVDRYKIVSALSPLSNRTFEIEQ